MNFTSEKKALRDLILNIEIQESNPTHGPSLKFQHRQLLLDLKKSLNRLIFIDDHINHSIPM